VSVNSSHDISHVFIYLMYIKPGCYRGLCAILSTITESGLKCRAETLFRNLTTKSAYSKKQPVVDYV
jgi:hypothetical protein